MAPWAMSAPRIRDRTRPVPGTKGQVGTTVAPVTQQDHVRVIQYSPGHPNTNTHHAPLSIHVRASPAPMAQPTLPLAVAQALHLGQLDELLAVLSCKDKGVMLSGHLGRDCT